MRAHHNTAANAALLALLLGTLASMLAAPHFWAQHGGHLAGDLLHAAEVVNDEVRHLAHALRTRVRTAVAR